MADGRTGTVMGEGKFAYGIRGDAMSMAGVVIDTTETNELRALLAARVPEFATVIENSPVILARFSIDLRHLYVSVAVEAYIGIPPARCLGKILEELNLPTEICEQWDRGLRQAIVTKQSESLRYRFPNRNGEERCLESRPVPDTTPVGEVGSVLAITADVTRGRTVSAIGATQRFSLSSPGQRHASARLVRSCGRIYPPVQPKSVRLHRHD